MMGRRGRYATDPVSWGIDPCARSRSDRSWLHLCIQRYFLWIHDQIGTNWILTYRRGTITREKVVCWWEWSWAARTEYNHSNCCLWMPQRCISHTVDVDLLQARQLSIGNMLDEAGESSISNLAVYKFTLKHWIHTRSVKAEQELVYSIIDPVAKVC